MIQVPDAYTQFINKKMELKKQNAPTYQTPASTTPIRETNSPTQTENYHNDEAWEARYEAEYSL